MSTKNNSLQEQLAKLDELVAWFEGDEIALEQALDKYRQAEMLAAEIEKELATFKNEITVLKQKFDA